MYGYYDYNGPTIVTRNESNELIRSAPQCHKQQNPENGTCDDYDDDDDNPLRVGLWMEGDSLAPPCGASISVIHSMLRLAELSSEDVLYDLGCGDGRVCLEAAYYSSTINDLKPPDVRGLSDAEIFSKSGGKFVGVEIESDLIERFHFLVKESQERWLDTKQLRQGVDSEENETKHVSAAPVIEPLHGDLRDVLDSLLFIAAGHEKDGKDNSDATIPFPNLSLPTVICMYLLPEAIELIQSRLVRLLTCIPNLRIVCNSWGFKGNVEPVKIIEAADGEMCATLATIRLYTRKSLLKTN
mmetsp:Transcript_44772/g.52480  ORF Transcript_44772/g.52480 Transcript_44772/m.52480 type:complete len:298 (-) Transcript_44772:173-1066(-)|eukprot:CAMPEP_0194389212 /NCGR_PEP_ID=MMETSP0174-20130528/102828_1 /TAXON_ID=216777 /ORGANISM="Proboscia alata, Strain PI-D3" /LENGTH=297 /DNA_ID=CAMNT_0039181259 /DNA_START=59 /DNA_END=952 /DNA_ORIENTATION=+